MKLFFITLLLLICISCMPYQGDQGNPTGNKLFIQNINNSEKYEIASDIFGFGGWSKNDNYIIYKKYSGSTNNWFKNVNTQQEFSISKNYYSMCEDGNKILYFDSDKIYVSDYSGNKTVVKTVPGVYRIACGPNSTKILVLKDHETESNSFYMIVMSMDGSNEKTLAVGSLWFNNHHNFWSPNGEKILYYENNYKLMMMNIDGTNILEIDNNYHSDKVSWTSDSKKFFYSNETENILYDITNSSKTNISFGGDYCYWLNLSKVLNYGYSGIIKTIDINGDEQIIVTNVYAIYGDDFMDKYKSKFIYTSEQSVNPTPLYIINMDGSNNRLILSENDVQYVALSPNGSKIAYLRDFYD